MESVGGDATCVTCGLFAVGRCKKCGAGACSRHGALRAERFLCAGHIREYDEQWLESATEATMNLVERVLDGLAAVPDPAHRFVVLLLLATRGSNPQHSGALAERIEHQQGRLFATALPRLVPSGNALGLEVSGDPSTWTFPLAALLRHWRQTGLLKQGKRLQIVRYQEGILLSKRVFEGEPEAWLLKKGYAGSGSGTYSTDGEPDVWLLDDGRMLSVPSGATQFSRHIPRGSRRGGTERPDQMAGIKELLVLIQRSDLALPPLSGSTSDALRAITSSP